jgi:hypothetical protein
MRRVEIGADPDQDPRHVALPFAWDDAAAAALAGLAPGSGPVMLESLAESWIRRAAGRDDARAVALRHLLLTRRAAPSAGIWRAATEEEPGYLLNLAAFHEPDSGFDTQGFRAAVQDATHALMTLAPDATVLRIGFGGLAELLALLGIDYDSGAARDVARCLSLVMRAEADAASSARDGEAPERLDLFSARARPAPSCLLPDLAEAARLAATRTARPRHRATTALAEAGPIDALLGIETGNLAPIFSPLNSEGRLSRTTKAALLGQHIGAETALAALYAGNDPVPVPTYTSYLGMHEAISPYLHSMPARPAPIAIATAAGKRDAAVHQELPARHNGYTQKSAIAGHRLFLRTGEYADGRLGEISVTLPRESAAVRGLMDGLTSAISLGLQHGVPLRAYVDALVNVKFGPSGAVDGDPSVHAAASPIDYVMRHLAASYLGDTDLPAAESDAAEAPRDLPLLPLDLPDADGQAPKRRGLRLVSSRKAS